MLTATLGGRRPGTGRGSLRVLVTAEQQWRIQHITEATAPRTATAGTQVPPEPPRRAACPARSLSA